MEDVSFIVIFTGLCALIAFGMYLKNEDAKEEEARLAKMTDQERADYKKESELKLKWGPLNPVMVCPHCQTKGHIRTMPVQRKKGISGGKATAALLTGGISVVATGLSRKENQTQANCMNCNSTWDF